MKKYLGVFALILVTVIWGGGFVASDMALETFTPFQIMFFRFLIASVIMALPAKTQIKKISRNDLISGAVLGSALFGGFALQVIGLQYTTPSKNAFLTATNVVMVPIIALIFGRKKILVQGILGAGIALVGVGVLSIQSGFLIGKGDMLTLLCAVCFAAQIYLTGLLVHKIDFSVLNFLQMLTAFTLSFVGFIGTGGFAMNPSAKSILAVLYLGTVSTSVCYFLQTWAQKYVDETGSAIILSMESVFGTFFSIIILHERITLRMIIGSLLILSAVLISELRGRTSGTKNSDLHKPCEGA
ncbi:DMT family transporter [Lachnoclostridium sp. Marseille-P6806]|uniref:DMT family transporter n=1 Tax=Lachnoclostridium sp. Marseille-P6806 TaxID=2364793 RepID=UPI001032052B|nr:DMT family transporter [Lachnoclostridium sp. Marseille-P6806]